jgi:hypothetical protein
LAGGKGKIRPKHAWAAGVIRMARNESHGIEAAAPLPFNSLMELPGKLEKLLIDHGVKVHPSTRMAKYLVED